MTDTNDAAELVRQSKLIPALQKAALTDGQGICTSCHHDVFTTAGTDRCEHVHRQAQGIEPSNAPAPTAVADVADVAHPRPHGWEVLANVEDFLARFVVYPGADERLAHVLWIGHTWFMDAWESTPRIAFLSPEPGSGKSRALEVTEPLVPNPIHAVNATPAYLFRKVSDPEGRPTILFDEIDTVFGPKAKDNEDLRGLLNAGHRKGAMAGRCVIRGKEVCTEELPAYAAVALAGLDDLPDTLMTRSVVVRMRRRKPGETVEPWRLRTCGADAQVIHDQLSEWADSVSHLAGASWPEMPEGVEDRDADVWEALLAVADMAGGRWPEKARAAATRLVAKSKKRPPSLGVLLLRDIRSAFSGSDQKLATEDLLDKLTAMDEAPWSDLRGKPLDSRGLARHLSKYGVASKNLRIGGRVCRGYDAGDFTDPWDRYLPAPQSPDNSATSATPLQTEPPKRSGVADVADLPDHGGDPATDHRTCQVCGEPLISSDPNVTTHPNCEPQEAATYTAP
ncbi:DUF3631 domain-containing protein [Acidipropionibacterium jensenii]|nr:DUF3631 domain-containing protein [Acidipropionibacterium jensenii]MDN6556522.1 DUF3631 domain-containing protein [Acidipropionibacterium acidipropionici]MDN5978108.1 DUF3631 domain-containing protein [Acidipropionibacterium jensenii]MDN5997090.1 DUF3631 domain-containing protein [Acidipropionibacterium jensenii]MDN6481075.1 DUF3631 domain-containing protein [Acidipropionibacterium jensenii]MDN6513001.1 DUF3631 domain-containing protein [Acidipropionibacterium jensenii]